MNKKDDIRLIANYRIFSSPFPCKRSKISLSIASDYFMTKKSKHDNKLQIALPSILEAAGAAASQAAARHRFAEYRSRLSAHTIRRHNADLHLFGEFLYTVQVKEIGDLTKDPTAWIGVTWGLIEAFVKWQLQEGYAVSSINVRLSTIKTYAKLAFQAGILPAEEFALIQSVSGYSQREKRRIDEKRVQTRVGLKKEKAVPLSEAQKKQLLHQPLDTLQGSRDALLIALLLENGLRAGELALLKIENIDSAEKLLTFYRPKVGKTQTHRLSEVCMLAFNAYAKYLRREQPSSPLLRSIRKGGKRVSPNGLTTRGISLRVEKLGEEAGISGLSAHDLRHAWATSAARAGTDPFKLQQAGGWSSLAMPRRYVEDAVIANEGLVPSKDLAESQS